ncbi:similar to Saccharomyces cerevisiae YLR437C DIF1 Protein that regulates nuclear localization of Rnr2p and Rnr4p [Maudiozyma saulgeensis]|uniref:Similar to Saccharomyces cerevisiae YLR437C DIF1 Protein that regulates nuclear localization of Rnr2p and Rnr4p n=1 Tax=Maudiozyma saulgeensis TaxID=1789683 RepID=A0A1X7R8J8_9SACH|nr:similar to Saccharomyces cerevisiae YLR437C DIF1 Protein that regulates nuclear localization of Rnr2p and Rnr4p [Kazachstania saulgeensis]
MDNAMNKQNKVGNEERFYSPNQRNDYMEKLSNIGMRIRQKVDSNATFQGSNANTNLYAGLIVPQYRQANLNQEPPMLARNGSSLSDLEIMNESAENINTNGKRSF